MKEGGRGGKFEGLGVKRKEEEEKKMNGDEKGKETKRREMEHFDDRQNGNKKN